jgi:hypothetical protein
MDCLIWLYWSKSFTSEARLLQTLLWPNRVLEARTGFRSGNLPLRIHRV